MLSGQHLQLTQPHQQQWGGGVKPIQSGFWLGAKVSVRFCSSVAWGIPVAGPGSYRKSHRETRFH